MAYILPVNSGMLSLVIPGKREELVCATALAAFCGCWLMGILSNYPFMLAPGRELMLSDCSTSIGLGAYMFYTHGKSKATRADSMPRDKIEDDTDCLQNQMDFL